MVDSAKPQPPEPAPEPAFFENAAIDNLIAVVLELGSELWVQRQRQRIVERLLAESGVVSRAAIEQYTLSEAEIAADADERQAFIDRLYGVFAQSRVSATPPDES